MGSNPTPSTTPSAYLLKRDPSCSRPTGREHGRHPQGCSRSSSSMCRLSVSRWSLLFAGPAALGRRPYPGRPICCAEGCPSASASPSQPSRRPSASSCAAARPSRTSSRLDVPRPVTPPLFDGPRGDDCGVPVPVLAAGRAPAHRLVVGVVKIVVYFFVVFSDRERYSAKTSPKRGKDQGSGRCLGRAQSGINPAPSASPRNVPAGHQATRPGPGDHAARVTMLPA